MSRLSGRQVVIGLMALLLQLDTRADAVGNPSQGFVFDEASRKVTAEILHELSENHYQKVALDDRFSSELLMHYLDSLDPNHMVFIQSDIDEFKRFDKQLDDQLKVGNLDVAQSIYTRFHQRSLALMNASLEDMDRYGRPYTGKVAEMEVDREKAPWPADLQESRDLWDKRLFNELLQLKLSNRKESAETPVETMRKRYLTRLDRLKGINAADAFEMFMNSALDLYDPHTEWFTPRSQENFKINMSLSLEGIGAVLQQEEDKTKIARLVTGGPAAKSGMLKAGDFILAVGQGSSGDMEDISGQRLDEVVEKVRGPKGSIVRLQVESADSQEVKLVMLEREKIKLEDQAAKSAVIERNGKRIGIINVPAFYMDFEAYRKGDPDYRSTTRDVEKLLLDLKEKKIDGLVIDLRNNGGGSLQEARTLTNLFISKGPVVQIRNSYNQIDRSLRAEQNPVYLGPLLVLTNRLSASASEIFAGAIQDYERGMVVGEPTFGKGTVQNIIELNYGQLKFTNAKFYRVSGESTQHRGVLPDVEIPSLLDFDEIGEGALPHDLPWDTIHETSHYHYDEIKPFVSEIITRHKERMAQDPDYSFLLQRIAYRDSKKKETKISLVEDVRKEERNDDNAWLLKATNEMRRKKKLPDFPDIKALEKYEEDQAAKWNGMTVIDLENDFLLKEGAAMLVDFIELKVKRVGSTVATRKSLVD